MKAALLSTAIPWQPQLHLKPLKPAGAPLCCSKVNGASFSSSQIKLQAGEDAEVPRSPIQPEGAKETDIWRLFREAQKNILHLNQHRLKAVEDLNKTNSEKQLLVDKIEQLELEKQQASVAKPPDRLSSCWEVLLRIDSMVLTGMIAAGEASDLRRLVMDNKESLAEVFNGTLQKTEGQLLAELRHFYARSRRNGFHIVHICTEMEPLVSVGSLASYVTGLSRALQRKGHLVEVILPKYSSLDLDEVHGLQEIEAESFSYFNGQLHGNRIWTGVVYGIGVTLIQPLEYSEFFNREKVYGYSDDFERFTYFSRASLDYIVKCGKQPDVIHIHNWETAIIGPLFWDIFAKQGLEGTRILLTCHDLNSQCLEHPDKLALCGLDPSSLHRPDRLQDNTKSHLVNILKGGVVYSNKVAIMSSILSKGRVIHNLSHGLDPTLNIHKNKLIVSPCGFDNSTWDPSKDNFIPRNFSVEDMEGKTVCKAALQQHLGLSEHASSILIGCIVSEVFDVDLENLWAAIMKASKTDVQFVIMGTSKISSIHKLGSLQESLKDEHVKFVNDSDETITHLVFAGSDIILCQSFHDPVLQVPLKALKYGTAPIALNSSHDNFRNFAEHDYETTNFSRFVSSTFGNMSISEALNEMKNHPWKWKRKILDAMEMDFSWDAECCDIHTSAYTSLKKL
ncbi:PREDICTED: probable starch synthase 4, chloroplastic/amyloplastic [Fragaria vesca subsp. vesca]|uniref:probable starch synthase 4, chloroplastic/amyloplastic n=1 Tax=Fragaria vesca subsp. vesca TaxID=101020 RepID=UPI0002C2E7A5|nr:PREDICTED: probable starch synthase 4, chloroplastic/amyloplastic [Fragaria vesca subsp. vesca]